jgi:hypothetical protein
LTKPKIALFLMAVIALGCALGRKSAPQAELPQPYFPPSQVNVTVRVTTEDGMPVSGITIVIQMREHDREILLCGDTPCITDASGKVTVPDVPARKEFRVQAWKGEKPKGISYWDFTGSSDKTATIVITRSPPPGDNKPTGGGFLLPIL